MCVIIGVRQNKVFARVFSCSSVTAASLRIPKDTKHMYAMNQKEHTHTIALCNRHTIKLCTKSPRNILIHTCSLNTKTNTHQSAHSFAITYTFWFCQTRHIQNIYIHNTQHKHATDTNTHTRHKKPRCNWFHSAFTHKPARIYV